MANISRSFYKDLKAARSAQHADSLPIVVTRLTKAGQPSKAYDATKRFATLDQANVWIANMRSLNPILTMNYSITGA